MKKQSLVVELGSAILIVLCLVGIFLGGVLAGVKCRKPEPLPQARPVIVHVTCHCKCQDD
jgi:hypothetical protein